MIRRTTAKKKEKTAPFKVVSLCHFNFYRFLPSESISMNNGGYFLRLYKHRFCLFISVSLFLLPTTTKLISKLYNFRLILVKFFSSSFFCIGWFYIRFWYDVVLFLLSCRVLCNISLWQILVTGLRFYLPYYEHLEKTYNGLGCAHTHSLSGLFFHFDVVSQCKARHLSVVNVIWKRENFVSKWAALINLFVCSACAICFYHSIEYTWTHDINVLCSIIRKTLRNIFSDRKKSFYWAAYFFCSTHFTRYIFMRLSLVFAWV